MGERGNRLARRLDRLCGIPLANVCGWARRLWYAAGRRNSPHAGRMAVLCFGAIGDLLLLSTLINGLRGQCPDCHITLITSTANAGAVPLLEGVDAHRAFRVADVLGLLRYLRRERFDILFDSTQWARLGALASALSAARCTVGFATPGQYRGGGYDARVPHRANIHEAENFINLGRALWPQMQGAPSLRPPRAPDTSVRAALPFAPEAGCHVVLHMWAAGIHKEVKEWPAAHWAALCTRLADAGHTVLFTGARGDAPATEAFMQTWFPGGRENVFSLAGVTDLATLHWILHHARAVVSVNTGVMHLAALAGAPTVGLHGATNPLRWGPVGPRTCALLPHEGAMAYLNLGFEYPKGVQSSLPHLPVEDVVEALRRFIITLA